MISVIGFPLGCKWDFFCIDREWESGFVKYWAGNYPALMLNPESFCIFLERRKSMLERRPLNQQDAWYRRGLLVLQFYAPSFYI